MTKVTLKILASDIKNSDYMDARDCAITRALKRAGYPQLEDWGTEICYSAGKSVVNDIYNSRYNKLKKKVTSMYFEGVEPKNFQVTLELDL